MRLLLLSNSTNAGEEYLEFPKFEIKSFLGNESVKALFIPYAAVTFSFDEYESKVKERFIEIGHDIISIHRCKNPMEAIETAEAIIVGGGNTFHLLKMLQQNNLIDVVKKKVIQGLPYIGWSAGANMACPTICTTNDMPIVETDGLKAFHFVPFQINPHYSDFIPAGHAGETRDQRIMEFIATNPSKVVVGLKEGTMLKFENKILLLIGNKKAKIFKFNQIPFEVDSESDVCFLMGDK